MKLDKYSELLAETPVGTTFFWRGKHRLVHMAECGRRYVTEVKAPILLRAA